MRRRGLLGVLAALLAGLIATAIFPLFAGATAAGPAYLAVASFSATGQHDNLAKLSTTTRPFIGAQNGSGFL